MKIFVSRADVAGLIERAELDPDGRVELERLACNRMAAEGAIDPRRDYRIEQSFGADGAFLGFYVEQD